MVGMVGIVVIRHNSKTHISWRDPHSQERTARSCTYINLSSLLLNSVASKFEASQLLRFFAHPCPSTVAPVTTLTLMPWCLRPWYPTMPVDDVFTVTKRHALTQPLRFCDAAVLCLCCWCRVHKNIMISCAVERCMYLSYGHRRLNQLAVMYITVKACSLWTWVSDTKASTNPNAPSAEQSWDWDMLSFNANACFDCWT